MTSRRSSGRMHSHREVSGLFLSGPLYRIAKSLPPNERKKKATDERGRPNIKIPDDQALDLVRRCVMHGERIDAVADQSGVPHHTLYNWCEGRNRSRLRAAVDREIADTARRAKKLL